MRITAAADQTFRFSESCMTAIDAIRCYLAVEFHIRHAQLGTVERPIDQVPPDGGREIS